MSIAYCQVLNATWQLAVQPALHCTALYLTSYAYILYVVKVYGYIECVMYNNCHQPINQSINLPINQSTPQPCIVKHIRQKESSPTSADASRSIFAQLINGLTVQKKNETSFLRIL